MIPKIFLIEDNSALRKIIVLTLNSLEEVDLCGFSEDAEEALEKLASLKPDLVLVDRSLPGMSGMDLVARLKETRPEIRCLLFTGRNEAKLAREALRAGACGYLVKGGPPDEFLSAIRASLNGECFVSPSVRGWEGPDAQP